MQGGKWDRICLTFIVTSPSKKICVTPQTQYKITGLKLYHALYLVPETVFISLL